MKTTTELTKSANAADIFRRAVKNPNFMTPELIGHYDIKNGAAELTTGRFMSLVMYGVTVVQDGKKADDLSQCFDNLEDAKEYIGELAN